MSEVPPVKLTKRQKKAIAHRSGGASASRQDKKKAKKAKLESLSGLPEEDHGAEDGLDEGAVDTVSEGKASQKAKGKQKADETTDTNGDNTAEQPKKKKSRLICFCGASFGLPQTDTVKISLQAIFPTLSRETSWPSTSPMKVNTFTVHPLCNH